MGRFWFANKFCYLFLIQFHASENYTSTLAHKLNHSFIANCEWSNAEHPCYGLVPSVTTCLDVLEGQELTINYGLDMEVCLTFPFSPNT